MGEPAGDPDEVQEWGRILKNDPEHKARVEQTYRENKSREEAAKLAEMRRRGIRPDSEWTLMWWLFGGD